MINLRSTALIFVAAFSLTACGEANTRKINADGRDATFTVHPQAGVCQMVWGISEKRGMFGFFQSRSDLELTVVPCTESVLALVPKHMREEYFEAGHKAVPQPYAGP
jgi:hypothetical protein